MSENRTKSDGYMLRLPDGMRDQLKADAEANGRSLNSEIVARLSEDRRSLRDWFAGQALASLGTWTPLPQVENLWSEAAMKARADFAYRQADAMLSARSNREEDNG